MLTVIKVAVIGMTGMILSVMLKNTKSEYSVLIGLATAVLLFFYIAARVNGIIDDIKSFEKIMGINQKYIMALLKMTGITYITEVAAGICRDGGASSSAAQIEMFGRLSIMGIGMSVIVTLVNTITAGL